LRVRTRRNFGAKETDGTRTLTSFDKWSQKDAAGIRWPIQTTTNDAVVTLPVPTRGPACTQPGRDGEPLARTGAACTAPAEDRVQVRWPPGGVVRLPLMYLGGELLVSVKVEGRQVHAFLDSGAGITVVDSTLPIGKAFVPTSNVAAQGATQKLRVGLGELPVVDLGDLHVEHLPTASVPIPSLEAFGDKRPEIVLGYTFFALGAVRVDYTKGEVVLAERAESLVEAGSRSVPMRVLGGKLVADVTIDGQPAAIELDTGNAGGIDLTKRGPPHTFCRAPTST